MTKPLALGKAVHKGIEMLIQGYILEEAVCEGFIEADFHPQVERSEVESLVKKSPVHAGMGETEVHFQLPLSHSPSAPQLQGYIDLVVENESGVWFVDWKTNWQPYNVLIWSRMPVIGCFQPNHLLSAVIVLLQLSVISGLFRPLFCYNNYKENSGGCERCDHDVS
ncbi:hypothetical protein CathTA2_0153 [Caldalkalibacillus thermarum TA2.A1]|uniref:PD-(D/E)XK endonuclease-like domain-containing protein n=1 Tax=Caldalkalibacillus thermarum (strain TA2.A1) TaxID=986075 RepID=F5L2Z3_CALTT|nr:hypothetical protein CathTA2_0153 [Caldalkalibacillus thermarum TA2.A1]